MTQKQLLIIIFTLLLTTLSVITAIRFFPFSTSLDFQKKSEVFQDLCAAEENHDNPIIKDCECDHKMDTNNHTLLEKPESTTAEIINLESVEQIKAMVTNEQPMVMKFSAEWCPACKIAKAQYPAIAQTFTGKVTFYAIDAQNNQIIDALKEAALITEDIEAIPTFILYQKGKGSEMIRGFSRENLESMIKKHFSL
ncbi:MAG: thioredoxin family protein [Candidatus Babeliales bacterium]|jgi:thiol-disulfide isomerase/thioredoxin